MKCIYTFLWLCLGLFACRHSSPNTDLPPTKNEVKKEEKIQEEKTKEPLFSFKYDSSKWVHITDLDTSIVLDIRYATDNNFTKQIIYDCPACFLRPETAKSLIKVHQTLQKKGYGGLKIFDCYRPREYQQKLWNIVPNPRYVAPPTKGSMHGRGKAVDVTIIDKTGKELNMGTDFDYFGKEAAPHFVFKDTIINKNRRLLKEEMTKNGFRAIRSEWWHFSYTGKSYPLSNWKWTCHSEK